MNGYFIELRRFVSLSGKHVVLREAQSSNFSSVLKIDLRYLPSAVLEQCKMISSLQKLREFSQCLGALTLKRINLSKCFFFDNLIASFLNLLDDDSFRIYIVVCFLIITLIKNCKLL